MGEILEGALRPNSYKFSAINSEATIRTPFVLIHLMESLSEIEIAAAKETFLRVGH